MTFSIPKPLMGFGLAILLIVILGGLVECTFEARTPVFPARN